MLSFDKISLGLEAKNSKSREIFFSSGCLRGEREISSHFSFFYQKKGPMHHYMTFPHCAFWYEQPFNISWQTVVLDFVPPSTWAAYQSPQLPQPCSQYYNTPAHRRKYWKYCNVIQCKFFWPTTFRPQWSWGRHFCSTEICQLASLSPLRKLARLKNFLRNEVSTLFTLKSQSLNKATWCMYICTKLRAPQIRHCRIPFKIMHTLKYYVWHSGLVSLTSCSIAFSKISSIANFELKSSSSPSSNGYLPWIRITGSKENSYIGILTF